MVKSRTKQVRFHPSTTTNLIVPLTSFVGRQKEILAIKQILAQNRLLTLNGPGGCGKTRLALRVAGDLLHDFQDGVCWVDLAPLNDPGLLEHAVAEAFKLQESAHETMLETLLRFLKSKQILLILDNCEHLRPACASMAERLLLTAPDLKILTTSREPLSLAGEVTWLVPPLSAPDREISTGSKEIDKLLKYDAVRLFLERSKSVMPSFSITGQNAAEVVQICRRLDGIPLAIELAAACIRILSVTQIASRLDNVFSLPTAGNQTTLIPRHKTLHAAIDWSYRMLTETESLLFRRLAVFNSGFTINAAETICAGSGLEKSEILGLLSQLIDKSLVSAETLDREEARFRMLEPVRQYALEKLHDSGEESLFRSQHLQWYLSLAKEMDAHWRGPDQKKLFAQIEIEYDNLRSALESSKQDPNLTSAGLILGSALWRFWEIRNHLSEGRKQLDELLCLPAALPRTLERAKALNAAGYLASMAGDRQAAEDLLAEALAISRELEDPALIASAIYSLGINEKDLDKAEQFLQESLKLWRQLGDQVGVYISLFNLGNLEYSRGKIDRAISLHLESLDLKRKQEDSWSIANSLFSLGLLERQRGNMFRAIDFLRESLALFDQMKDSANVCWCLRQIGFVAANENHKPSAVRLFAASSSILHTTEFGDVESSQIEMERILSELRAGLGQSEFETCWQAGQSMTLDQAIQEASTFGRQLKTSSGWQTEQQVSMRIFGLGAAWVFQGERELVSSDWVYAKAKELFFYLLLNPPQTKEQIGLALWPDVSITQLHQRFRITLYHLRKALGHPQWILFEDYVYRFNRSLPISCDVEVFESRLAILEGGASTRIVQAMETWKQVIELYRGNLLDDMPRAEWCIGRRETLLRRYINALLKLGQLFFEDGKYNEAMEMYQKAINSDPYLEEAHRGLMRCYARQGEFGLALKHYHSLAKLIQEEFRALPSDETIALYEEMQKGQRP